ncbi:hypothetical protein [Synechococcus sp. MU1642]|uniref:hypothetical protein n=1 Tax=Synechococcus sp. MU1642 TaxID=2508348 RepID=UPI001CF8A144|nr:hypothetical protein [Synechococcus sp. MU1642]MCB4406753.1 hypothetical protein [Synechococcus sp. MU1642]
MCLLAAIGLLAPRLVLVLLWVINSSFVLQPFSGATVPNPVLPVLGLLFLPTTTLGYCWAVASLGGVSSLSGLLVLLIVVIIYFGLIGNGRGAVCR